MPTPSTGFEHEGDLPPPGSRWGAGAGSVLPYLTRSLKARPAIGPEHREPRLPDSIPLQERPGASPA